MTCQYSSAQPFPDLILASDCSSVIGISSRRILPLIQPDEVMHRKEGRRARVLIPASACRRYLQTKMAADKTRGTLAGDMETVLKNYYCIPALIKIEYAARFFETSRSTLRRCISDNLITSLHIGRSHYVLSESAAHLFRQRAPDHA